MGQVGGGGGGSSTHSMRGPRRGRIQTSVKPVRSRSCHTQLSALKREDLQNSSGLLEQEKPFNVSSDGEYQQEEI